MSFDPVIIHNLLLCIDKEMRDEEIGIPYRSIRALGKLSIRLNNVPIVFGSPLANFVRDFYDKLYGDLTKLDFIQANSVIKIGSDLFRFAVPVFYGRVRLNIGDLIPDLKPELFDTLTAEERLKLERDFHFLFKNLNFIAKISHPCIADLDISVTHMVGPKPAYGLSRWSSLQATEKYLKHFINEAGEKFDYTHDLRKLFLKAQELGLPEISLDIIEAAQCRPAVRYETTSTKQQAVLGHYAAIQILAHIGEYQGHRAWA